MNKKILVVGAGFSGATIARILADAGYMVDVIDQRSHVAGNAYDEVHASGIRIHNYGPHLFHTSNMEVVKWLSKFTTWVDYKHKVKALLMDGRYVTLPVNKETISAVGEENVLDIFFRPYTRKMWGVELEKLDPEILSRVPVRNDDNELYFPNDTFQALPSQGYTSLVEKILEHPKINTRLSCKFENTMEKEYFHIFNSMAIDEYFNYAYGRLPYRSIRFHTVLLDMPWALPTATVNFTHDGPYTRVTEWKHLPNHGAHPYRTVLTFEEPCDYLENNFERHYPVKDVDGTNRALYRQYYDLIPPYMTFVGRCGKYAYLDMHQAVNSAMSDARQWLAKQNNNFECEK